MSLNISESTGRLIEAEIAEIYTLGGGAGCPNGPQDVILRALKQLKSYLLDRRVGPSGTARSRIMRALFEGGELRSKDVAERAELERSRTSELLTRLSLKGLTTKTEQGLWKLTDAGVMEAADAS